MGGIDPRVTPIRGGRFTTRPPRLFDGGRWACSVVFVAIGTHADDGQTASPSESQACSLAAGSQFPTPSRSAGASGSTHSPTLLND